MGEMKELLLASITPSKTNPRRTFDIESIQELADSISEKGVIQPILVRPIGEDKYELVCGERRYRASLVVQGLMPEKDVIPAHIKEISDDEVIELQITENLQRKDVHPMDEAASISAYINAGKDPQELADRLGKKLTYVNNRLKLAQLIEQWQKVYYYDKISMKDALSIAMLEPSYQEEVLKECIGDVEITTDTTVRFSDWNIKKYQGGLDDTNFDLSDSNLIKSMGACIGCKFNSSTASLFPSTDEAKCYNIPCYKQKSDVGYAKALQTALEDPDIVLLSTDYREQKPVEGKPVFDYMKYNAAKNLPSEPESFEEFKEHNTFHYDTEKEFQEGYDEYKKEFYEDLKEHAEKIANGTYVKGLFVDGSGRGLFRYVQLNNKAKAKAKSKATSGNTTNAAQVREIEEKISGIEEREARKKELDNEKIHAKVKELLKNDEDFKKDTSALSDAELRAAIILLMNQADYRFKEEVSKKISKTKEYGYRSTDFYDAIEKLSSDKLSELHAHLVRNNMLNVLMGNGDDHTVHNNAKAVRMVAFHRLEKDVKTIDLEQQEEAMQRQQRVDERIKAEKKKIEALKPKTVVKKKAPTKKAAGKKATAPKSGKANKQTAAKKK